MVRVSALCSLKFALTLFLSDGDFQVCIENLLQLMSKVRKPASVIAGSSRL